MSRKTLAILVCSIVAFVAISYLVATPSDEALIAKLQQQPEVREIVAMYQADQQPMVITDDGATFPENLTSEGISAERLATYRTLLQRAGIGWTAGGGPEGAVTLYIPSPLQYPTGPIKSLVYMPQPPLLITNGPTDHYTFTPGQYRRVCRPIETNWYVCKDYED
jgi:hypothetical protein